MTPVGMVAAYIFRPIRMWIAFAFVLLISWGVCLPAVASIPSATSASDKSIAHSNSLGGWFTCTPITTFAPVFPRRTSGRPWRISASPFPFQSTPIHPAVESVSSIKETKPSISGSESLRAISYSVPENCLTLSTIRPLCSLVSVLGALYLANSRLASSAFCVASAARAFASAIAARDFSASAVNSAVRK